MEVVLDRDAFLKGLQMVHNIVEPRQTLFHRRERRERGVWLRLVPIGDGVIVIRSIVGVTMLNGRAQ